MGCVERGGGGLNSTSIKSDKMKKETKHTPTLIILLNFVNSSKEPPSCSFTETAKVQFSAFSGKSKDRYD